MRTTQIRSWGIQIRKSNPTHNQDKGLELGPVWNRCSYKKESNSKRFYLETPPSKKHNRTSHLSKDLRSLEIWNFWCRSSISMQYYHNLLFYAKNTLRNTTFLRKKTCSITCRKLAREHKKEEDECTHDYINLIKKRDYKWCFVNVPFHVCPNNCMWISAAISLFGQLTSRLQKQARFRSNIHVLVRFSMQISIHYIHRTELVFHGTDCSLFFYSDALRVWTNNKSINRMGDSLIIWQRIVKYFPECR